MILHAFVFGIIAGMGHITRDPGL